jgi:cytochrome P450
MWLYRPYQLLEGSRERYGTPFTLRLPGLGAIVVFDDPDAIKEIFTGSSDNLYAGLANEPLRPVVGGRSLLLLDGPRHLRERRLLLPPFHGARMQRYGEIMREVTEHDLRGWPLGETFKVQPRTQAITLDIILRTVFGTEEGAAADEIRAALYQLIVDFSSPSLLVPALQADLGPRSVWGRFVRTRRATDALVYGMIDERRRVGTEGRDDILSMLLDARYEDGSAMSEVELRDELVTMLVAGHETTATGLSWAFHHLIEHPQVQAEVHAELDRVIGGVMGGRPIEPEHELPYLDAVIKETLRVVPVIAAVGRVLQTPTRIGGLDLPAGIMVTPSIYLTHRNPRLYPDPDRFDPSRFLGVRPNPYAWLPFGGGVRRCIGMAFALYEMRVVLRTVLATHRVRAAPGVRIRPFRRSVTMAPSNDMPMVLERR